MLLFFFTNIINTSDFKPPEHKDIIAINSSDDEFEVVGTPKKNSRKNSIESPSYLQFILNKPEKSNNEHDSNKEPASNVTIQNPIPTNFTIIKSLREISQEAKEDTNTNPDTSKIITIPLKSNISSQKSLESDMNVALKQGKILTKKKNIVKEKSFWARLFGSCLTRENK